MCFIVIDVVLCYHTCLLRLCCSILCITGRDECSEGGSTTQTGSGSEGAGAQGR